MSAEELGKDDGIIKSESSAELSQVDAVARPNRHAHVVVVTAAGVDIAGVELAEPLNSHRCILPAAGDASASPGASLFMRSRVPEPETSK